MLSAPARKANAIPIPMSGTARTRVADVKAYHEPAAPCHSAASAASASYPASSRPAASTARPRRTARSGVLTATGHHQLTDLYASRVARHLGQYAAGDDHHPPRQREDL